MTSSKKDTSQLIEELSSNCQPRRPVRFPLSFTLPWLIAVPLYIALVSWLIGLRPDWQQMLVQIGRDQIDVLLALAMSISAAAMLGWMALPDRGGKSCGALCMLPFGMAGAFLVSAGVRLLANPEIMGVSWEPMCFRDAALLTLVPTAAMVLSVRRGAPTSFGWTTMLMVLAVTGFGWVGLRLTCAEDAFSRAYVMHLLPFILLGLVVSLLARRLFRW